MLDEIITVIDENGNDYYVKFYSHLIQMIYKSYVVYYPAGAEHEDEMEMLI